MSQFFIAASQLNSETILDHQLNNQEIFKNFIEQVRLAEELILEYTNECESEEETVQASVEV